MSNRHFKLLMITGLLIYGTLTIFPFLWMLITSFKPVGDTFKLPPTLMPSLLLTDHPFLNFELVFQERNFLRYFINSCIVAILSALGQLFTCSLAGFAFARIRFPGKKNNLWNTKSDNVRTNRGDYYPRIFHDAVFWVA